MGSARRHACSLTQTRLVKKTKGQRNGQRFKEGSTQQIKNRTGAENQTKRERAGERQQKGK